VNLKPSFINQLSLGYSVEIQESAEHCKLLLSIIAVFLFVIACSKLISFIRHSYPGRRFSEIHTHVVLINDAIECNSTNHRNSIYSNL